MADTKKTATFIRVTEGGEVTRFGDGARLYRCEPPMPGYERGTAHEFVWASSAEVPFSGPETYLFGADADGKVVDWGELDGSRRGRFSHAQCFANAGYEVVGAQS